MGRKNFEIAAVGIAGFHSTYGKGWVSIIKNYLCFVFSAHSTTTFNIFLLFPPIRDIMNCEMCGMETKVLKKVLVEGTVLSLCPKCAKYGKELSETPKSQIPAPLRKPQKREEIDIYSKMPDEELVEDYNERIKRAREARGWSQEELGKRINEKKSIIAKIEAKEFRPPDALAKKLEATLNIKLLEKVDENVTLKSSSRDKTLTLGDMIVIKEEKKKK